ncbi:MULTISPECIES: M81 family metallopeptidase [unclassified Bradyrhizobium]|uniref:M81 family metallopeptidase n=1 Tax=unclassified Bradyrhizobium TaxID=2631580 RepID=UPI001BA73436|nr:MULTISPECIES: M81 family metallopeptidase [unclassified Bradyrhizobium]MBR1204333.1 M81 family metallopeptidase [Bradyrhizobium sp. AUGA SZCCT0124]MBR1309781.1 M81 family metallopeptidase [Bradyrhizobium sp. AUGA SZCCT0051]MBR1339922.1 M81 family metallopeptidase [Bradyrhizobium sp. AUGA SZCCT0105]MBR1354529.1 M81 family metallopeptidase [Bradyrhizobium sp. AUGA SZCCT0045]
MTRIAVGGFLHETNTFAPTKATYDDFVHGGGWPSMTHGSDVLRVMRKINAGLAGFVEAAEANGWELAPTVAAGATPSAHVTKDAFERIVREIVDGIAAAGPIDGVYLDLHGAMVTEHYDDGEGEILARVRKVVGKDIPLVASLDLHANVSPEMIAHADALIAYRTYPHVDMADTGRACARHLALLLKSGERLAKAFRQLPFLIPISWQCTNDQPAKNIYQQLASLESDAVPTLSFAFGFPAADFRDCGPSVFTYGRTQADADAAADRLVALVEGHENDFDGRIYSPDDGVRLAMELAASATRPIVIADTQDNPGAGGTSDTTGMLRALVRNKASAATGVIFDPQSAKAAHEAGVGATVTLDLGGKSGIAGDAPYRETFVVEKLSDGRFVAPGPFYGGRDMDMGPSACLRVGDVRVVVGSYKAQLADQSMYRYVGIEPTAQKILVNKSSVHFRADFEPIAEKLLICAAPGAMPADTATLPWKHLRPGIRIKPNGPTFTPSSPSRTNG